MTNYKEGSGTSANQLRLVKITDDLFAIVYRIEQKSNKTGIILIDSAGNIQRQQEYDVDFSGNRQPIYVGNSIIWMDDRKSNVPDGEEQCFFTKVYLN